MKKAYLFLALLSVFYIVSCEKSSDDGIDTEVIKMKEELKNLAQPLNLENGAPRGMKDEAITDVTSESNEYGVNEVGAPVTYKTTIQKFKASAAFDTQILLNPSTDVIYPGSVLLGHTIDDGSYMEVTSGTKKDITISYDLTGVKDSGGSTGSVSGTIKPSLSNYREFHNKIHSQEIPSQSSIYSYEYVEINDESEMDLKFKAGANYTSPAVEVSVKAGFEYSKSNKRNKYMIKFMQTFYTVDIDQNNGTFLYDGFDIDDFKGYLPVYVSSVAYGRLAYLTIETTQSWESIKASLDVIVETATYGNYDANFNAELNKLKKETKFNITVIGGNTVATSVTGFDKFLREGGYSKTNSGKIISYKLRFVHDNSVANTIFNGQYTVRRVEMVEGKGIKIGLRTSKIKGDGSDGGWGDKQMEYYGTVQYKYGSATSYLWSRSSGKTYNMGLSSTKTLSSKDYPFQYNIFNSSASQFTVEIAGFKEKDDTSGDDSYSHVVVTKTVGDVNNGDSFVIRTKDGSNYVDFTITVVKEMLY